MQEYRPQNLANPQSKGWVNMQERWVSLRRNGGSTWAGIYNLPNFIKVYNISIHSIYKNNNTWSKLCNSAKAIPNYSKELELEISRAISKKWLACTSFSYFKFIIDLAKRNFKINLESLSDFEKGMCLMLYYDFWQDHSKKDTLENSISCIGKNETLVKEIIEFLEIRINQINYLEKDILLPYPMPLKIHSRYTRDQILAAFGVFTYNSKPSYREGVVNIERINTELLLVTLEKNEKDFSPTTLYNDFAISDTIFHWQSQNSAKPEDGKGKSYITHKKDNKKILLFIRERNTDENGLTMGYVFLGFSNYIEHSGSKPMNIKWELEEPIPSFMWNCSAKLAIG